MSETQWTIEAYLGDKAPKKADAVKLANRLRSFCRKKHIKLGPAMELPNIGCEVWVFGSVRFGYVRVVAQYDIGASERPAGTYMRADALTYP